jgi:sortase A
MSSNMHATYILRLERILFAFGLALLLLWGAAWIHRTVLSRAALATFAANRLTLPSPVGLSMRDPQTGGTVNFALWSSKRIDAFKNSLVAKTTPALAIVRIPKISLDVPVFEDTDDLTLNRGLGRIIGTAHVGQPGNLGLAGHRDGFLRGLKDVQLGDTIELALPQQTDTYTITRIQIVNPDDVSVLSPTQTPTLTLVTCYPFYFIGSAPQRYIVTASLTSSSQTNASARTDSIPNGKKSSQQSNNEEKK